MPLLGLKPDRTYTVDVHLSPGGPAGTVFATTAPLPAEFPSLVTTVSDPAQMEPGYTLLDCRQEGAYDHFGSIGDLDPAAAQLEYLAYEALAPFDAEAAAKNLGELFPAGLL